MLTITNKLDTCLVIPEGLSKKGALFLDPKGKAKVEKINDPLKEAERNGLVAIRYPAGKKPDGRSTGPKSKKEKQESNPC